MSLDRFIRPGLIGFTVVGFVVSIYLAWLKFTNRYALCGPIGDCESVNTSPYSEIMGIPIALLGVGAYGLILILIGLERRDSTWSEISTYVIFGISLVGTLYSAYLTFIEIAILRAICPYCVVSAIAMTGLLILSILRLVRGPDEFTTTVL
jgi:uncharacterized membrane protein